MKEKKIVLIEDRLDRDKPEEIFCGYIEGNHWLKSLDLSKSRVHHQFNRIYSANGIHPTLSASETQGRYYVYEGEDDI